MRDVGYSAGEVRLVIEDRPRLLEKAVCAVDGASVRLYDHGEKRVWRHLNVFEHVCYIECRLPRLKCTHCGKVSTVKAPWEGRLPGLTLLFEAFALTLLREMPVKTAAGLLGLHDTRLWRLLDAYVPEAYAQADFSGLRQVGCDELNSRKGQHYLTVFADLAQRRVLFATPGRDASTWSAFAAELPRHGARVDQIEQVSIDMSAPYAKAARRHCPKAQIVWDRFHVMKNVGAAVDEVRQREHRRLLARDDARLRRTMWLWRRNPDSLSQEQTAQLQSLKETNLLTAKAYQMRLTLRDIYELPDPALMRRKLLAWSRWVMQWVRRQDYVLAPMKKAAKSIRKHIEGIVAFAQGRLSNAYMEAINSVFSAVKRKARGFRTNKNLTNILYFTAAKLQIPDARVPQ